MPIDVTSKGAFKKKKQRKKNLDPREIIRARYVKDTFFQASPKTKFIHHTKTGKWLVLSKELFIDFLLGDGYFRPFTAEDKKKAKETRRKEASPSKIKAFGWTTLAHSVMSDNQVHCVLERGLAGIPEGLYIDNGYRCLCLQGPTYVTPKKGFCGDIEKFMPELFPDEQVHIMEELIVRIYKQKIDPEGVFLCQIPILVGEKDCGKSLFKDEIFIPLLGGRYAECISFMSGDKFNGELGGSDVWVIDDQGMDTRFDQDVLSDRFKKFAAERNKRIEEKFQPAINLHIKPCMIVCLNTGSKNLRLLPDMGPDIEDKILGFLCGRAELPKGKNHEKIIQQKFRAQLPAYLYKLLHQRTAPEGVISEGRFGIIPYFHPELQKMREATDYAISIFEIIARFIEVNQLGSEWKQTPSQLFEALTDDISGQASRISLLSFCRNPIQLGFQLTKLTRFRPAEVLKGKHTEYGTEYVFKIRSQQGKNKNEKKNPGENIHF
jgi:hypothetical protein